jgi:carbonic anhydrase
MNLFLHSQLPKWSRLFWEFFVQKFENQTLKIKKTSSKPLTFFYFPQLWFCKHISFLLKQLKMKQSYFLFAAITVIAILFTSCQKDDDDTPIVDCTEYHWEYDGDSAPETWPVCTSDCGGNAQSPVNIAGATTDASLMALETHYEQVPIELINNGHTVEFEYEAGSVLKLNGDDYALLQFHFHTSSEHTVDGTQYPMEAHLVHRNSAGALAVIGIFFEEGSENAFLKNFSDHLPAAAEDHFSSEDVVNVESLLPSNAHYYTYTGSLTTPPCSEIVTWLVMKAPVEASALQISAMHSIVHDNYRPVQPLNGRTIREF